MVEHKVALVSSKKYGKKAPPEEIGRALSVIGISVKQAISMAIQGQSSPLGRTKKWLKDTSDIRFVDISGRSDTVLHFEAPTIGEAFPELYEQKEIWPTNPDEHFTGFDILGSVINDIHNLSKDSLKFDRQLLRNFSRFRPLFNGNYQTMVINDGKGDSVKGLVNAGLVDQADNLRKTTPSPQMSRIVGSLDMITWSTNSFGILLDQGEKVRGILTNGEIDVLKEYGNQRILVEGKSVYRPSGKLLRIEATSVELVEGSFKLWTAPPKPLNKPFNKSEYIKKQTDKNGIKAVLGIWPGDETDEELLALLECSV